MWSWRNWPARAAEEMNRRDCFHPLGLMRVVCRERSLDLRVADAHVEEAGVPGCCRRRKPRCTGG